MQAVLQIMLQGSLQLSKECTGALETTVQNQTPHLNGSALAVQMHITETSTALVETFTPLSIFNPFSNACALALWGSPSPAQPVQP